MNHFPPFCSLQPCAWPAPLELPGAQLVRAQFDPALLHAEDFQRCGIAAINGVAKRQGEYLAGRLCAREALRQLHGKPSVPGRGEDGAPQWPSGVVGSITHGAGQAAALVAHARDWQGLGLDVEQQLSATRAAKLAGEILTPAELERASGLEAEAFARLVTLTFSLKESLFKALYPLVRQRFYFHDAELLHWGEDGRARLRLLIDLGSGWSSGSELDGQFAEFDGYLLSLIGVAA
ncbi:4'-phosphopantetheinyl transferase family protein [Aquipseudomonas guryensis]|jgi:enterobactin synthetase component D|uniref:Enterobactin synthase component D n=1 Tax=Aquipseudomonas guryensis TaxID=2759165 RepID=A0A7W4H345_9GAMM|nr:4'-phosphopantetheinyl transferase superfamily protein [Pseudomonas guryensis]MBB1519130.1 4'-phosphopantetheinyl transferase superfamily protein [Pseudomonas guryensis]